LSREDVDCIVDRAQEHGALLPSPAVDYPEVLDCELRGFSTESFVESFRSHPLLAIEEERRAIVADILRDSPMEALRQFSAWRDLLVRHLSSLAGEAIGTIVMDDTHLSYTVPLHRRGGTGDQKLEVFLVERKGGVLPQQQGIIWDLVAHIKSREHLYSSVIYVGSWQHNQIVNACVCMNDHRNPIMSFLQVVSTFQFSS
tara:strand:+ start:218 stop:817 length:600 start_codon:yes stop_codon:yes gene_type:complete